MKISKLQAEAESGDLAAQCILGIIYLHGIDVAQDYEQALRWLTPPADLGVSRALFNLGLIYERGLGVPADLPRAFALIKRSAERGEWMAFVQLARLYLQGRGTPVNAELALHWYRVAVEGSDTIVPCEELNEALQYIASNQT